MNPNNGNETKNAQMNILAKLGQTLPGEALLIVTFVNTLGLESPSSPYTQSDIELILWLAVISVIALTFISRLSINKIQLRTLPKNMKDAKVGYALLIALTAAFYVLINWGDLLFPKINIIIPISTILGVVSYGFSVYLFPNEG